MMHYPVNALNPKVETLIKLAELMRRCLSEPTIASDAELLAWYDRMAELEYIPQRLPSATSQRYQTYATHKMQSTNASYVESVHLDMAMQKCLSQFKPSEGWYAHSVKNLDTGVITEATSVILFQEGHIADLRLLDGLVDRIECGTVISALSLDEDEPAALSLDD